MAKNVGEIFFETLAAAGTHSIATLRIEIARQLLGQLSHCPFCGASGPVNLLHPRLLLRYRFVGGNGWGLFAMRFPATQLY
jgi:hypothetical protein